MMLLLLSHKVVPDSLSCTIAHQAPLAMEFSRQEYWNGLPFLSPGDLPNPGIKPESPVSSALADKFFIIELPGKPLSLNTYNKDSQSKEVMLVTVCLVSCQQWSKCSKFFKSRQWVDMVEERIRWEAVRRRKTQMRKQSWDCIYENILWSSLNRKIATFKAKISLLTKEKCSLFIRFYS